jgi:hypothetical protein
VDSKVLVTLGEFIHSTFILINLVHIILKTGIAVDEKAFKTLSALIFVTTKLSELLKISMLL